MTDTQTIREFSYEEVTSEARRLGIDKYPVSANFSREEVLAELPLLEDYHLWTEHSSLKGKKFTPAQVIAFAKLAETLGKNAFVEIDHNGLKVMRETEQAEREASARSELARKANARNREAALASLKTRYEAGEID